MAVATLEKVMDGAFDSMGFAVQWANEVLEVPASTYVAADRPAEFVIVERTGGETDWPHEWPEFAFACYAGTDAEAQHLAYSLAVAAKVVPITESHLLEIGTPSVFSYGRDDSGCYVWQVNITFGFNMI